MVVLIVVAKTVKNVKEGEYSTSKVYVFEQKTRVRCIIRQVWCGDVCK